MSKNKIFIIVLIVGLLVVVGALVYFANQPKPTDNNLIFYYGDGCSHCANVEKFLTDNGVEQKITLQKKEVFNNQTNQAELAGKAQICGLPTGNIGVPFLWDGPDAKCITGDTDVINFFKQKLGIQ